MQPQPFSGEKLSPAKNKPQIPQLKPMEKVLAFCNQERDKKTEKNPAWEIIADFPGDEIWAVKKGNQNNIVGFYKFDKYGDTAWFARADGEADNQKFISAWNTKADDAQRLKFDAKMRMFVFEKKSV